MCVINEMLHFYDPCTILQLVHYHFMTSMTILYLLSIHSVYYIGHPYTVPASSRRNVVTVLAAILCEIFMQGNER
jgi:Ni,Fe-hydrogenase I cytochrome b subunit